MKRTRPTVCVIDDDADIREVLADILTLEGYDVVLAVDGASALQGLRARKNGCCLILLDLMMPGMNGWEFRRQQLSDSALAPIPVLLMTGAGDAAKLGEELNTAGALEKPVDLDSLLLRVSQFCGS
jgi:CheY-like chemotaxis protein